MANHLPQGFPVLPLVLFAVGPDEGAVLAGIGRGVGDGVELVVPHHGQGVASVHHGANDLQGLTDLRSAIDEVPEKHDLPVCSLVCSVASGIAQLTKDLLQFRGVAVDVTDQVVHGAPSECSVRSVKTSAAEKLPPERRREKRT